MVKVFVFAGQSNMDGRGNRLQLAPVPSWAQNAANGWEGYPTRSSDTAVEYPHPTAANSPSLYLDNNGGLTSTVVNGWGTYDGCNPPFGFHAGEQSQYGPELSFLQKYRTDHPGEQTAVLKVSLGGSSLGEWLPPAANMWQVLKLHLDQAKARFASSGLTPQWAGFVWMQGENGCSTVWPYLNDPQRYSTDLRTFLAAVRSETAAALPVVIGRIGSHMLAPNVIGTYSAGIDTPASRTAATNHRRSQQVLVGGDPGNSWFDTDSLPVLQTGDPAYWYHHTGAGYLAMGERAYAAWLLASGEVPPPPPPPLVVTFNGVAKPDWQVRLNNQPVGGPGDTIDVTGV